MAGRGSSDEAVARARAKEAREYTEAQYVAGLKREYAAQSQRNDQGGKRRAIEVAAELRRAGVDVPDAPKRAGDGRTTR